MATRKKTSGNEPGRYVVLLRGVNVSGKNRLDMKEARALLEELGGADVESYIQSGNLAFSSSPAAAAGIGDAFEKALVSRLGVNAPVVLRDRDDLAAVLDGNPFLDEGGALEALHVGFLKDRPDADAVASLDENRSPPDRFIVRGSEVFFHLPNGVGKTKLSTAWFDARLRTVMTQRNWKTVRKLAEMVGIAVE